MEIKEVDIKSIKPYEKNAKDHPESQISKIAKSIEEFGFNQPIVIDKEGVIIVGHGRYYAAKKLGLDKVPVLGVNLTEEQAKAYRLADNKLNESAWDMRNVIDELKSISIDMLDMTGFERDLIIEDENKDDIIPTATKEIKSKIGDLYELGNHRILCGDSTNYEDAERLMGGALRR